LAKYGAKNIEAVATAPPTRTTRHHHDLLQSGNPLPPVIREPV
jgi:hypothetical protein